MMEGAGILGLLSLEAPEWLAVRGRRRLRGGGRNLTAVSRAGNPGRRKGLKADHSELS
jgi:hypothetical protein